MFNHICSSSELPFAPQYVQGGEGLLAANQLSALDMLLQTEATQAMQWLPDLNGAFVYLCSIEVM